MHFNLQEDHKDKELSYEKHNSPWDPEANRAGAFKVSLQSAGVKLCAIEGQGHTGSHFYPAPHQLISLISAPSPVERVRWSKVSWCWGLGWNKNLDTKGIRMEIVPQEQESLSQVKTLGNVFPRSPPSPNMGCGEQLDGSAGSTYASALLHYSVRGKRHFL